MAIDFDGSTGGVSFGSASTLDNVFDGGGTLMAWIKPSGWGANNRGRIWDKAFGTSPTGGWAWYISNFNGWDFLALGHNFSFILGEWVTPIDSIVLNTLYHITVTYNNNSSSNNAQMYIDGQMVTTTRFTSPLGTRTSDAAEDLILATNAIVIRSFDGLIDDPRVYNRILSAEEIQTIYNARGRDMIIDDLVIRPDLNGGVIGSTPVDGDIKDLGPHNHYSNKTGTMPYIEGVISPRRFV